MTSPETLLDVDKRNVPTLFAAQKIFEVTKAGDN